MLGVTLITDATGSFSVWEPTLRERFPLLRVEHDERAAQREGLLSHEPNRLVLQEGGERVYALERPTTEREYSEEDLANLSKLVPGPRRYFAIDYSDRALLRELLRVIATSNDLSRAAVADDEGVFATLLDYLSAPS